MVWIYLSMITEAPRTVSMGFDLKRNNTISRTKTFTVFLIRDNNNLKRGILQCVSPLHLIHCAQPAEVSTTARQVSGQKTLFFISNLQQKLLLDIGVSSPGCSKDQTLLPILFPVDFSSRMVLRYMETVTDIIKGLTPVPPHMPS